MKAPHIFQPTIIITPYKSYNSNVFYSPPNPVIFTDEEIAKMQHGYRKVYEID
jgi:hypothetical protein